MNIAGERNKLILCIIAVAMVVCIFFTFAQPIIAYAAESKTNFDKTDVLDDLKSSTVNGASFNLNDYPLDEKRDIQIITFVEYCYSYKANKRDNYGLYIYVYNPKVLNISTSSRANKIQMAVSYDEQGNPARYEKFNLEFCSKVGSGDYKNRFYKFKITDKKIDNKTFVDRIDPNARRYDVSGIELLTYGAKNAIEYGVGGTYTFTGYAQGFGPDATAKSTLSCTVENLETLELEVHHTNYRTNVSSLGKNHYNEVNTVYFSVPQRIYEEYGYLQKIRAEWWEYKTKVAAITSNKEFYDQLKRYTGIDVGEYSSLVPVYLYSGYEGQIGTQAGSPTINNFDWVYNRDLSTKYNKLGYVYEINYAKAVSSMLPYAFYSPTVDVDSVFKFLYSDPIAGDVNSTEVQEYIYNYKNNLGHGYIDCNHREISVDLFEDYVDEGRTRGYNDKTIDLSDTFDLNSYDSNYSWWDKLWDYGFSWPKTDGDYKNVAPIYELKESDFTGTDKEISERLLINQDEVYELKNYFKKETKVGNKVVLFRFANTDYYCAPAFAPHTTNIKTTDTYVAQQTVFFDFDIIELTFNKDGVYHVIPAVASPTDIINGFTQPQAEFEWWKLALALLVVIAVVLVFAPIIPYVVWIIIWLITLPVKLIKKLKKPKKETNENKGD